MILLEVANKIVQDTLTCHINRALNDQRPRPVCLTFADFDGVLYRISNPSDDVTKLNVSIAIKFFQELVNHGGQSILIQQYGNKFLAHADPGYDITIRVDLEKSSIPDDWEKSIVEKVASLKRNCIGAIFETYFEFQKFQKDEIKSSVIHYRDDETMYLEARNDRVTVVFSTIFKNEDDIVLGKVFLQSYQEAGRKRANAPQVIFTNDPPENIEEKGALVGKDVRYITFVLFPRHTNDQTKDNTINLIHQFRNYLHYHIKCSKIYIHSRMRTKTHDFLEELNKAKPEKNSKSVTKRYQPISH